MGIINEKKKTALLTGIICKSMTINYITYGHKTEMYGQAFPWTIKKEK